MIKAPALTVFKFTSSQECHDPGKFCFQIKAPGQIVYNWLLLLIIFELRSIRPLLRLQDLIPDPLYYSVL